MAHLTIAVVFASKSTANNVYANPNKAWEVAALGVPILASDSEELGRMVSKYNLDYLVDSDDADGVAQRLIEKHDRRDELRELGSSAKEGFLRELCWDKAEQKLAEAYEDLLSAR